MSKSTKHKNFYSYNTKLYNSYNSYNSQYHQNHHNKTKINFNEIKKGDIVYADLSPVIGSEQGGVRPVMVIQNDKGNKFSTTLIIAPISSQKQKAIFPTHVSLPFYYLPKNSYVLLEQIRTIDKSRIEPYVIGHADKQVIEEINKAIKISLDL